MRTGVICARFAAGIAACTVTIVATSAVQAWSLVRGVYGPVAPNRAARSLVWPLSRDAVLAGPLASLADHPNRSSGYWESEVGNAVMRQSNTFNYEGGEAAFNRFLAQYAQVPGIQHTLVLGTGPKIPEELTLKAPTLTTYDWQFAATDQDRFTPHDFFTAVRLPVNGKINLHAVTLPKNVHIGFADAHSRWIDAKPFYQPLPDTFLRATFHD